MFNDDSPETYNICRWWKKKCIQVCRIIIVSCYIYDTPWHTEKRALRYNQHLHSLFYYCLCMLHYIHARYDVILLLLLLSRYLLMMTQFLKVKLFEEFTDFLKICFFLFQKKSCAHIYCLLFPKSNNFFNGNTQKISKILQLIHKSTHMQYICNVRPWTWPYFIYRHFV